MAEGTRGSQPAARGRWRSLGASSAAMAWVVALAVGQLVAGGRLVVVPWLALGPLGASLVLLWPATTVVALSSVVAVALLSVRTGDLATGQGAIRVLGSAALAGFAVLQAVVRVRREERVRRVAEVAAVAQTAILHPVPARVGQVVLASRYVSATSEALVGGDLFDVVATAEGVRVITGDARGKGLSAVHVSAAVLSAFRHAAPQAGAGLDEVARSIQAAIAPRLGEEDFVTAVLCDVRPDGRLDLVRCGHPAPLLLSPGQRAREVGATSCPPLGLGVDPLVEHARLGPGERLLLYTDGLVEARNARGAFFDLEGCASALPLREPVTAEALDADLEQLMRAVRAHVGGTLTDDVAALLLAPLAPLAADSEPGADPGSVPAPAPRTDAGAGAGAAVSRRPGAAPAAARGQHHGGGTTDGVLTTT